MASPSEAACILSLKNAAMFFEKKYTNASTESGSELSRLEDIRSNANSAADHDWKGDADAWVDRKRRELGNMISPAEVKAGLTPHLRALGKCKDFPETDPVAILDRLYLQWIDDSKTLKTRAIVPPSSPQSLTGTGNGEIHILTTDAYGYAIQAGPSDKAGLVETVYAQVTQDQGDVPRHEEIISLRGGDADPFNLEMLGTGGFGQLKACSARQGSGTLLKNGSFDFINASGVATGLDDWTLAGTGSTTWAGDGTNYYRSFYGQTVPYALRVNATMTIRQALDKIGLGAVTGGPCMLVGRYNRTVGMALGSMVVRYGASTLTIADLSTGSGWQEFKIALGTGNWWKSAKEDSFDISIEPTLSGGYLLLDDVMLVPMTRFGMAYYAAIGGTTPWMRLDKGSWTFSETRPVLQFWLQYGFNRYLPHAASPTITDPS